MGSALHRETGTTAYSAVPPWRHRWRKVLIATMFASAGALAWVKLGWSSDSAPRTPSSLPNVMERPALVTKGDDIGAVVRTYIAYQQWMLENPEDARVGDIYHANSDKGQHLERALRRLAERRERFHCDAPPQVTVIDEPHATDHDSNLRIVAHVRRASCRLVDATNRVVAREPGYERRAFSFTFERVADRWYVLRDDDLGNA